MAMTFHLDVVTAEQQLFSGTVEEVIAPGVLGDLGILLRHSQLISKLRAGELQYPSGAFLLPLLRPLLVAIC